jgi:glycosyltransferase involved in cell wall biosynthesis
MMEKNNPFFSVIIATYNRGQLIERALKSLISQTETSWEAIIIDDGSTDESSALVSPYMEKYFALRYLKQDHCGMAGAKNKGIDAANGKFVTFLDSDDEYHPLHLETRMRLLMEHPLVSFLYGRVKILGSRYVPDRFDVKRKVSLDQCIIGGSFIIERNTALMLKGFRNIEIGSDADLFDRARCAGVNMMEVYLPTYIYHHENADSLTNRTLIQQI